ncbi:hypothetical protein N7516_005894 [Penicillium verrucosum]|uniref:uncharacterized protein n=1 Tax=Penicillium verrucosum TaxID=60171 RepID=UPI002544E9A8|nr:uncharacterized protein N7516_005894 [Penicillium verrucosum]KAJ5931405.1 hypothetical protein N7516_005894 [Penicillium verrucosum]
MKSAILLSIIGLASSLSIDLDLGASLTTGPLQQTKTFELNLTWEPWAADGVQRPQALINSQFPGPALIMDEGDNVEVTVNNRMPFNTTIHYHGIEQQGTPWSDGVPGVSQKLIPPGGQFVSSFVVRQYGTYWPQKTPESLASMITDNTKAQSQIYDAIKSPSLVILSDWFHMTSEALRQIAISADIDVLCADSVLVNGKGRVNCRDPGYLTDMVPDSLKSVLQGMNYTAKGCLPLQNTYAQTEFSHNFSLVPSSLFDECVTTDAAEEIIEVDSLNGWALTINNGGRYSCLVQLNQDPGNYSITVANSGFNQKIAGFATLSYLNGVSSVTSVSSINYGGISTGINKDFISFDETTIEMLAPSRPKDSPDETFILTTGRIRKAWEWSLNGNNSYGLALEAEKPLLWDPQSAVNSSLVIATKNNTWVDIIFSMSGDMTTLQPSHPLHKHSNRVYVLGTGTGSFNWSSVAEAAQTIPENFNLDNPPMRDTFTTLPAYKGESWLAVRYNVQNSGIRTLQVEWVSRFWMELMLGPVFRYNMAQMGNEVMSPWMLHLLSSIGPSIIDADITIVIIDITGQATPINLYNGFNKHLSRRRAYRPGHLPAPT